MATSINEKSTLQFLASLESDNDVHPEKTRNGDRRTISKKLAAKRAAGYCRLAGNIITFVAMLQIIGAFFLLLINSANPQLSDFQIYAPSIVQIAVGILFAFFGSKTAKGNILVGKIAVLIYGMAAVMPKTILFISHPTALSALILMPTTVCFLAMAYSIAKAQKYAGCQQ